MATALPTGICDIVSDNLLAAAKTAATHILLIQHHLHCNEWDLHASTRTDPSKQLVPNPDAGAGCDFQCVEHTTSDNEDNAASPHGWIVGPNPGDEGAYYDAAYRDADKVGNASDATPFSRSPFDCLKVERKVVDVPVCSQRLHELGYG